VLYRSVSPSEVLAHCGVASYTRPEAAFAIFLQRAEFLRSLTSLAEKELGRRPRTSLDVGCSYGHLLALLEASGCQAVGTETCEATRNHAKDQGFSVFKSVEELPPARFELITLVDSLYYFVEPRPLPSALRDRLTDDGRLLIRVANRNWIAILAKHLMHRQDFGGWLGDASVFYSLSSVRRLLEETGYRIRGVRYWESGKVNLPTPTRVFYWASYVLTALSFGRLVLSPGITVVASKR
jgi:SAM-dependent methyltransferase